MVDFFKSLNPKLEIVKKEPIEAIPDEKIEGKLAIKCKQLEKTQLNGKEVKCIISEAKYDDENDMIFKVETPSENWSVTRTYRDFTWLQDQLSNMRPKQPIPELISAYGCETEKKIRKIIDIIRFPPILRKKK